MSYRVVIPCAGTGSRLGSFSKKMNKALVTVGHLPVIVHIVRRFPKEIEIVVPLGYKGDQVRQVLLAFFPDRKFIFVNVDNFDGPGSGLGYSLRSVMQHLQCPFIFCSNDTLITDDQIDLDPSVFGNWMGYHLALDYSQYRTLSIDLGTVQAINPKGTPSNNIYIGLCGVEDYREFWEAMMSPNAVETGEAFGMKALDDIAAIEFESWNDTGNLLALDSARKKLSDHTYNILEKEDEAIWFYEDRVIKFSVDERFISDRIERLKYLPADLFPKITLRDKNLYSYKLVPGQIFSKIITPRLVWSLLDQVMAEMWFFKQQGTQLDPAAVGEFYKQKTLDRVKKFLADHEMPDRVERINDLTCPPILSLLNAVDWKLLCTTYHASLFHGDFHNENIIYDGKKFTLLDWRQNFGEGQLEFGDAYYDLAKFHHGLIVSHNEVSRGNFSVNRDHSGVIRINISRDMILVDSERAFFEWVRNHGFDENHVRLITALIFLNIAPLHERGYGEFLFFLGRLILAQIIDTKAKI